MLQQDDVQPPGRDTVCLAEAIEFPQHGKALVIGCGTGLLPLWLARGGARVTAVDINPSAVTLCAKNSAINNLGELIECYVVDIRREPKLGRFDLVVCNPPQLPGLHATGPDSWISQAHDGGPDGRTFIRWICDYAQLYLSPVGVLKFTHFDLLRPGETAAYLRDRGYVVEIVDGTRKPMGLLSGERLANRGGAAKDYGISIISAHHDSLKEGYRDGAER